MVASKHFREELSNEALGFEDAWAVLEGGNIYDPAEFDVRTGDWKYRVEGYEPGGKWIVIIFTFRMRGDIFLITIFSIESRSRRT